MVNQNVCFLRVREKALDRVRTVPRLVAGFTLIELLVVTAILALLAGTAMVTLRQPLASAKRLAALESIRLLDATARRRSADGTRLRLMFREKPSSVMLVNPRNEPVAMPVEVGGGRVIVRGAARIGSDRGVYYRRFGTTPTYAVQIRSARESSPWLLILGMTGQTYLIDDARTIDAIMRQQRHHAD